MKLLEAVCLGTSRNQPNMCLLTLLELAQMNRCLELVPMILVMVALIAIQAVINLIADWNLDPKEVSKADELDEEELEAIKRSVGKV